MAFATQNRRFALQLQEMGTRRALCPSLAAKTYKSPEGRSGDRHPPFPFDCRVTLPSVGELHHGSQSYLHASTSQPSWANAVTWPFSGVSFFCGKVGCGTTNGIFGNAEEYDAHMRKQHGLFPCMFCPRLLANSSRRMVHRKSHGHKKPCTVCGRACCLLLPCPLVEGADRHCHDNGHLPAALAEFGPLRPTKTGYKPRQSTQTVQGSAPLAPEPQHASPSLVTGVQHGVDMVSGHGDGIHLPSSSTSVASSSAGTQGHLEIPPQLVWSTAVASNFSNSTFVPPQTYPPMPRWSGYPQANYGYGQGHREPMGSYVNVDAQYNTQNWFPQNSWPYQ
ncbi:hypothetical protein EVG20_g7864 [Dentipellis fragilis]|uniref:C2H2-type domain-containing protein n=1 Tax=Dentipellis fragilis TaxID=205917 RepID=A0A4Y9YCS0_9AGAM|nr:hypothetical protein EVG20_g7864 [Dentipellis fragilis]